MISKRLPKALLYRLTLVGKTARSTRKEAMFTERAILLSAQHDWTGTHIPKSNIHLHVRSDSHSSKKCHCFEHNLQQTVHCFELISSQP